MNSSNKHFHSAMIIKFDLRVTDNPINIFISERFGDVNSLYKSIYLYK